MRRGWQPTLSSLGSHLASRPITYPFLNVFLTTQSQTSCIKPLTIFIPVIDQQGLHFGVPFLLSTIATRCDSRILELLVHDIMTKTEERRFQG